MWMSENRRLFELHAVVHSLLMTIIKSNKFFFTIVSCSSFAIFFFHFNRFFIIVSNFSFLSSSSYSLVNDGVSPTVHTRHVTFFFCSFSKNPSFYLPISFFFPFTCFSVYVSFSFRFLLVEIANKRFSFFLCIVAFVLFFRVCFPWEEIVEDKNQ